MGARAAYRAWPSLLLLLGACSPAGLWLEPPADRRSSIVLVERDFLPLAVTAIELADAAFQLPIEPEEHIFVFFYAETLEELDLVEGPIPEAQAGDDKARALPDPKETFELAPSDEPHFEASNPERSAGFKRFRFGRRVAPEDCASMGGCYADDPSGRCVRPCPEPSPFETLSLESFQPEPPARPSFLPCPSGWREIRSEIGLVECDPFPAQGAPICGPKQAWYPGRVGCAPVGAACPPGDFADDLPAGRRLIFAKFGAAPGGDGTRSFPFATLAEALGAANADAAPEVTIALGPGRYGETVTLSNGRELRGACSTRTILTPPMIPGAVTLNFAGSGSRLMDVSVEGGRAGVVVLPGVTAQMIGVEIDGAGDQTTGTAAVFLHPDASLVAEDLIVRGSQQDGVYVGERARFEAKGAAIERSAGAGVVAGGQNILALRDVWITGSGHVGLLATESVQVTVERSVFSNNRQAGASLSGATTATLTLATFLDNLPLRGQDYSSGLAISNANAVLSKLSFVGSRIYGLEVRSSTVDASDLVSRGEPESHAELYFEHSRVFASRIFVERASQYGGFYVRGAGSVAEVQDLTVRTSSGTAAAVHSGKTPEEAIFCAWGPSLRLERADLEGALDIVGPNSSADLEDAKIFGVQRKPDDPNPTGISVAANGALKATRVVVIGGRRGLTAGDWDLNGYWGMPEFPPPACAELTGRIELSESRIERSEESGIYLRYDNPWSINISGIALLDTAGSGVELSSPRQSARIEQIVISGAHARETGCEESECKGSGILVTGGRLEVNIFRATRGVCGVAIIERFGETSELDLSDGLVAENQVGLFIGVPEYPIERLLQRVVYRDNTEHIVGL